MMLRILPLKIKLTIRELKLTHDAMLLTNYVQSRAPVNHLQSEYRYLTLAL